MCREFLCSFRFVMKFFTLTMMLFYVSGKCFKQLGDSDLSGKVLRKTIKRGWGIKGFLTLFNFSGKSLEEFGHDRNFEWN